MSGNQIDSTVHFRETTLPPPAAVAVPAVASDSSLPERASWQPCLSEHSAVSQKLCAAHPCPQNQQRLAVAVAVPAVASDSSLPERASWQPCLSEHSAVSQKLCAAHPCPQNQQRPAYAVAAVADLAVELPLPLSASSPEFSSSRTAAGSC